MKLSTSLGRFLSLLICTAPLAQAEDSLSYWSDWDNEVETTSAIAYALSLSSSDGVITSDLDVPMSATSTLSSAYAALLNGASFTASTTGDLTVNAKYYAYALYLKSSSSLGGDGAVISSDISATSTAGEAYGIIVDSSTIDADITEYHKLCLQGRLWGQFEEFGHECWHD